MKNLFDFLYGEWIGITTNRYLHRTILFSAFLICVCEPFYCRVTGENFFSYYSYNRNTFMAVCLIFILECIYHLLEYASNRGLTGKYKSVFLKKITGTVVTVLALVPATAEILLKVLPVVGLIWMINIPSGKREKRLDYFHSTVLVASCPLFLCCLLSGVLSRHGYGEVRSMAMVICAIFVLECVYHLLFPAYRNGLIEGSTMVFLKKLTGWIVIFLTAVLTVSSVHFLHAVENPGNIWNSPNLNHQRTSFDVF